VRLGTGASAEQLRIRAGAGTAVDARDAPGVRVEQCQVHGVVSLRASPDAQLLWNEVDGHLVVVDGDRVAITGNRQRGDHLGIGLLLRGGTGARVDGNHFADDDGAIRLERTEATTVSANHATGVTAAVAIDHGCDVHVVGNHLAGGRAVHVSAGSGHLIASNVVDHADTGVLLEHLAAAVDLTGNRFEGCRVGILAWSHEGTTRGTNRFDGCRDHDAIDPQSDRR
jgi:nitrous oxidase accessory protein NosD